MMMVYIDSVFSGAGSDFFLLCSTQTSFEAQKYA